MMRLTVGGVDVSSRTIFDVTVKAGRDDIESQPDASILNFRMSGFGAEQVGDLCVLTDDYGSVFSGAITDLSAEQDNELHWSVAATAAGPLATLGHLSAGVGGWPEENDSQRIYRILEEVGLPHNVNPDVAGPLLLEHPVSESVNAADAARQAANDGLGVLWESPNDPQMRLQYLPARQRTWVAYDYTWRELPQHPWKYYLGTTWSDMDSDNIASDASTYPGAVTLDASATFAALTFEQSIGDYARTVAVIYGTEQGGGAGTARPIVTAGDQPPEVDYDTRLSDVSDATTYATTRLRLHQQPAWRLTRIGINALRLTQQAWWELRRELVIGLRITVPFPHGSPVGTQWQGYLEGWQHAVTAGSHILTLNVSDRHLTEPADRWQDISASVIWDAIPSDVQWVYAVDLP